MRIRMVPVGREEQTTPSTRDTVADWMADAGPTWSCAMPISQVDFRGVGSEKECRLVESTSATSHTSAPHTTSSTHEALHHLLHR
jgi:hypothetical protein